MLDEGKSFAPLSHACEETEPDSVKTSREIGLCLADNFVGVVPSIFDGKLVKHFCQQ